MNHTIDISRDFSDVPGGRFHSDGAYNGEDFRERLLVPALKKGAVTVILDNTEGFGSSFLEEAFGGLIRHHNFADLEARLNLVSETARAQRYKRLAERFIAEAISKKQKS